MHKKLLIIVIGLAMGVIMLSCSVFGVFIGLFSTKISSSLTFINLNYKYMSFAANSKDSLLEADLFLQSEYDIYKGYFGKSSRINMIIKEEKTSKDTVGYLISNKILHHFDSYIIEGKMFEDWDTNNMMPIVVGGANFEKNSIGDKINVKLKSETESQDIDIESIIVGKINAPLLLPELKNINILDTCEQAKGVVVAPDLYADILLKDYHMEVVLCFDAVYDFAELKDKLSQYGQLDFVDISPSIFYLRLIDNINFDIVSVVLCVVYTISVLAAYCLLFGLNKDNPKTVIKGIIICSILTVMGLMASVIVFLGAFAPFVTFGKYIITFILLSIYVVIMTISLAIAIYRVKQVSKEVVYERI